MKSNSFSTTFGKTPDSFISRTKENNLIIDDFTSISPSNYVFMITGIKGSGKTVLLTNISKHIRVLKDWIVVDVCSSSNILENIASELYEYGQTKKLFTTKEFSFSF